MTSLRVPRFIVLLAVALLAACAETPQVRRELPVSANQSRIMGRQSTITYNITVRVALAPEGSTSYQFVPELIVPAGKNRILIRETPTAGPVLIQIINEEIAKGRSRFATFEALPGREYLVDRYAHTLFEIHFRVTDLATQQVVADTRTQSP